VAQSRSQVAEQFGVTRDQVTEIEREGMDNEWPPLG
jgi:DNA-binding XRE family transcriptional regulator